MMHPERQHVIAALEALDDREWPDCLEWIHEWARELTLVDPDDPTPAPAAVKAAAEAELSRLKSIRDEK